MNLTMRDDKPYLFKFMPFSYELSYKKYRKRLKRKLNKYGINIENIDNKQDFFIIKYVEELNILLQNKNENDVLLNKFKNNIINNQKRKRL